MIIGVTFSKGEWPMAVNISPLDLPEIINSGKVPIWGQTEQHWYRAAAIFIGNNIVYDFILREQNYCPIRFRPGYIDDSCRWA